MIVQGHVDETSRESIRGWAWDPARPERAVELELLIDDRPVMRVIANAMRNDLRGAGIGDGRHGFAIDLRSLALPLTPMVVRVQAVETGTELQKSPIRLEAPPELNATAREAIEAMMQAPGSEGALRNRLEFLVAQADGVLQRLADRQSNRYERALARSRKWRWRPENGSPPLPLLPRALIVDSVLPVLARDAGSNAVLSHAQSLQRLGYEVSIAAADMRAGGDTEPLLRAGIAVLGLPWRASVEEVIRRDGEFDLVYLHRIDVAHLYAPLVRQALPGARIVYNVADLHHLRLQRQAEIEDRPEMAPAAAAFRTREILAAASADAVITHSPVEAALLRQAVPKANVSVVPWATITRRTGPDFAARSGIAFIGHYGHAPNFDAALLLVHEIMPAVWQQAPEIRCYLAGSDLPEVLKEAPDPRIVPLGRVDTLAEVFDRVRLTVAPLQFGAGLKGKVLDSLAAGIPCVCTPIAAEGFDLPPRLRALVHEDTAALAGAIVSAHEDAALFAAGGLEGMTYVRRAFSESAVDDALRRAIGLPEIAPVACRLG